MNKWMNDIYYPNMVLQKVEHVVALSSYATKIDMQMVYVLDSK